MHGREALLARLDALGIEAVTHDHPAVFTVEESRDIKAQMPGGHTKNLFLTDKKGTLILLSAWAETVVPLKQLHKGLGCGRLSFGSGALLEAVLGVRPGSVTAFALLNDVQTRVRFYLDAALLAYPRVYFHPMENTASTGVAPEDVLAFARACGHAPEVLDLKALAEPA